MGDGRDSVGRAVQAGMAAAEKERKRVAKAQLDSDLQSLANLIPSQPRAAISKVKELRIHLEEIGKWNAKLRDLQMGHHHIFHTLLYLEQALNGNPITSNATPASIYQQLQIEIWEIQALLQ